MRMKCLAVLFLLVGLSLALPVEKQEYDVETALREILLTQSLSGETQSYTAQEQLNAEDVFQTLQNFLERSPLFQRLLERFPVLSCVVENVRSSLTPETIAELVSKIRSGEFRQVFREAILLFRQQLRTCRAEAKDGGEVQQIDVENIVQRLLDRFPVLSCVLENIRRSLTPETIRGLVSRIRSGEFRQIVREAIPLFRQQFRTCRAEVRDGGETRLNVRDIFQFVQRLLKRFPVLRCVAENVRSSFTQETIRELVNRIRSGEIREVVREAISQIIQQFLTCNAETGDGGMTGGEMQSNDIIAEMMDDEEAREQIFGFLLVNAARRYGACIIRETIGDLPSDLIDRLARRDWSVLRGLGPAARVAARQCIREIPVIGPLVDRFIPN